MILNDNQNNLLKEALESTFGEGYNINKINKLYGGSSTQHTFDILVNDTYQLICRFIDETKESAWRAQERICTQKASDMDVAPQLIYFDTADKILLLEKAQGSHINIEQLKDSQVQIAIASQLNIWHQADPEGIAKTPSLLDKINKLATKFDHNILRALGISSINELTQHHMQHLSNNHTVIHGDPNPSNMILLPSGTVHLIDWSCAGIGEPWLDFAMISQYLTTTDFWYNLITEHNGNTQTQKIFTTYNHLLHVHCCLWALEQAEKLIYINNIQEDLATLVAKQQTTCSINQMQSLWLNNEFNTQDHIQYIMLAKLMINSCMGC